MAHFAHVIDGVVRKVHVVANEVITDADGVEQESLGQEFLATLHGYEPEQVIQCSYNASFRAYYPGAGWGWREDLDAFIPPKPEPYLNDTDFVFNEETLSWEPVEG